MFFYFTLEQYFFFSCEHRVYILIDFQSYIGKIKVSSSNYIMNFDMS